MADFQMFQNVHEAVSLQTALKEVDDRQNFGKSGGNGGRFPLLEYNGNVFGKSFFQNSDKTFTLPNLSSGSVVTYQTNDGHSAYGQIIHSSRHANGFYVKPITTEELSQLKLSDPHLQMHTLHNSDVKSLKSLTHKRTPLELIMHYLPIIILCLVVFALISIIISAD